jgi:hypothetical protein
MVTLNFLCQIVQYNFLFFLLFYHNASAHNMSQKVQSLGLQAVITCIKHHMTIIARHTKHLSRCKKSPLLSCHFGVIGCVQGLSRLLLPLPLYVNNTQADILAVVCFLGQQKLRQWCGFGVKFSRSRTTQRTEEERKFTGRRYGAGAHEIYRVRR